MKNFGLQLFTIREEFSAAVPEEVMGAVKAAGYSYVQASGELQNIEKMGLLAKKIGLDCIGSVTRIERILCDFDEAVRVHKSIAAFDIGISASFSSAAEVEDYIKEANLLAERLFEYGISLSYHNHSNEFITLDNGKIAYDMLIEGFTSKNLYFMPDTYWMARSGADVRCYIERLKGRIRVLHLKDAKMTADGTTFAPIGKGNLRWPEIIRCAEDAGVEYYVVEQDRCEGSPFEAIKQSADYLLGMKDERLMLGVGREIITPKIGTYLGGYSNPNRFATSVLDDLTVTAFAFGYGEQKCMLISVTLLVLDADLSLKIRKIIEENTGIAAENIIIHTTHTHSGPVTMTSVGWGEPDLDYFENVLLPKTVSAAKSAYETEQHVTFGYAFGNSLIGVNRREPNLEKNSIELGVWEYGCFDPKMTILSFKNDNGECVANIIHYGCHATGCGSNLEISRDWPGMMTDRIEAISGGITAFINGPEGDVGPRLSNHRTTGAGDVSYMVEQGAKAAFDASEIFRKITSYKEVELKCTVRNIRLPLDPLMSYEEAKKTCAEIGQPENGVAKRKLQICKETVEFYENGCKPEEFKEHEQIAFRIGDIAFVGHPFETFSEIGIRTNIASPIPHVLTVAMANGSECYLPTVGEIAKGGYEVRMFKTHKIQPYANNVDYSLITESLETLEDLL